MLTVSRSGGFSGESWIARVFADGSMEVREMGGIGSLRRLAPQQLAKAEQIVARLRTVPAPREDGGALEAREVPDGMTVGISIDGRGWGSSSGGKPMPPKVRAAYEEAYSLVEGAERVEGLPGRPLVKVAMRGGLCPDGPCDRTVIVYDEGWLFVSGGKTDPFRRLEAHEVAELRALIRKLPELEEGYGDCCNAHSDGSDTYVSLATESCGFGEEVRVSSGEPPELKALIQWTVARVGD